MRKLLVGFVVALVSGAAMAQEVEPVDGAHAAYFSYNIMTGETTPGATGGTTAAFTAYNNTEAPSAANAAFSSTSLTSQWGDRVTLHPSVDASNDMEDGLKFTIFNSGTSAGPILTYTARLRAYSASQTIPLAGDPTIFDLTIGPINFGAGLAPGYFSIITVSGLTGFGIGVENAMTIVQERTAHTGTANRMGIASMVPITVGSSPNDFYANSATIGPEGFYTSGTLAVNPGYKIVVPEPATLSLIALAGLFAVRRRR